MRRRGQVVLLLAFLFFLLERGWGIPLGSPQLLLKGSLLAGVGGVYFDPAPAPREYFIGEELRGNGEFRLGLQYTPFPFTFELSGRYLVRERNSSFGTVILVTMGIPRLYS